MDRVFRGALFLFLACTDIVIITPGPRIDTSLVAMLKSLDTKRRRVVHELKRSRPQPARGRGGRRVASVPQPGDVTPTLTVLLRAPPGCQIMTDSDLGTREVTRRRAEGQLRRAFERAGLGGIGSGGLFTVSPDGSGGRPLVVIADNPHDVDPAEELLDIADEVGSHFNHSLTLKVHTTRHMSQVTITTGLDITRPSMILMLELTRIYICTH